MKTKEILMSLVTIIIVTSQFIGCTNGETTIRNKIKNNEEIIITVEKIPYKVNGQLSPIDWTVLQEKTSNHNTRKYIDKYFNNYSNFQGIKYGPFYINKDNCQESNNTLFNILGNKYIADKLSKNMTTIIKEISQYLNKDYIDLEGIDYKSAMFNSYFELIPDNIPNYFNGGASLSRAESMALVMRAVTPVNTLESNTDFKNAVSGTSYDFYIPYAEKENNKVYISTIDGSLNADNFAGIMTRGEYIYLVMNEIYGIEVVQSQDISKNQDTVTRGVAEIEDCTNNSKIADILKLDNTSNQFHSACLQFALQNVDNGVPNELYKAIVMAYEKGIINSKTRWNIAITKTEAIKILIAAMQAYYKENGYLYNIE